MATAATSSSGGSSSSSSAREGSAKTMVAEQISQTIQSTSNLLNLMLQSSPAQAQLAKLPKNLLAKASTIKNTEQVLNQLPRVVSSLDMHIESGLQSVTHLKTVIQLLANIESGQLKSMSKSRQEIEARDVVSEAELKSSESSENSALQHTINLVLS